MQPRGPTVGDEDLRGKLGEGRIHEGSGRSTIHAVNKCSLVMPFRSLTVLEGARQRSTRPQ